MNETAELFICYIYIYIYIYINEDDLQLGKSKENCFATQVLSQTQKNVSEPQTGIEPTTF